MPGNETGESSEIDDVRKPDESPGDATEEERDRNEQEMYKLRAEYNNGDTDHAIRMLSEVFIYEEEAINDINGRSVERAAP